jgi:hypothetical protein
MLTIMEVFNPDGTPCSKVKNLVGPLQWTWKRRDKELTIYYLAPESVNFFMAFLGSLIIRKRELGLVAIVAMSVFVSVVISGFEPAPAFWHLCGMRDGITV